MLQASCSLPLSGANLGERVPVSLHALFGEYSAIVLVQPTKNAYTESLLAPQITLSACGDSLPDLVVVCFRDVPAVQQPVPLCCLSVADWSLYSGCLFVPRNYHKTHPSVSTRTPQHLGKNEMFDSSFTKPTQVGRRVARDLSTEIEATAVT